MSSGLSVPVYATSTQDHRIHTPEFSVYLTVSALFWTWPIYSLSCAKVSMGDWVSGVHVKINHYMEHIIRAGKREMGAMLQITRV